MSTRTEPGGADVPGKGFSPKPGGRTHSPGWDRAQQALDCHWDTSGALSKSRKG